MRTNAAAMLVATLLFSTIAAPAQAQPRGPRTGLWTAVGAGAGFGLGLLAGFAAFDGATYSERKIWTTAVVGAAAGGTLGYFLSRDRRPRGTGSAQSTPVRLSDREVEALARGVPVTGLRAGSPSVVQSADADASARRF